MTFPSYRVASIEDLLARCSPPVRALVLAARRRVLAVVPGATERLRAGWGLLGYDAPRYFAFIVPVKDHVRIGFERGVLLEDPAGLLEGTGSRVRHVVIGSAADLRSDALAALLRQAAGVSGRAPRRASRTAGGAGGRAKIIGPAGIESSYFFPYACCKVLMSSFFIRHIAFITRLLRSGLLSSIIWPRTTGTICHGTPYLSLSQPHSIF